MSLRINSEAPNFTAQTTQGRFQRTGDVEIPERLEDREARSEGRYAPRREVSQTQTLFAAVQFPPRRV